MDEWMTRLAPQLRALVALAESDGHMTLAAAELGIPQSSMSRRIHALEAALHVPLLVRDGRAVTLTPAAEDLARRSRGLLLGLERAIDAVTETVDEEHGTIRFGFPLTMGSGLVPDLLAEFHREHPGVHLELRQGHGSGLFAELRAGTLDLAITIPPPDDLRQVIIASQRISVVLPGDHRLAGRRQLRLEELEGETFIANPPTFHLRRVTESWCQASGFEPDIPIEISEFDMIRELISRRLGIALLPRTDRPVPGTVEIALAGQRHRRDVALAWSPVVPSAVSELMSSFLLRRLAGSAPPLPRRGAQ